jgi:DNA polymerase-3 subunit gamma/tau
LYRKYRPRDLGDVIGQPQVTEILSAAAKTGQFAHAYLFTGQRGTGKTSTARILAHLINATPYDADDLNSDLDIIEIDAASRGSVDDARELRDKSAIAPVAASHKIYIIDEVHMLSTPAFNALLKIIEEPPAHIVFILATTEIQKVPATILSRVQRFHFRPVSTEVLAGHLRQIADAEKIAVDDEALNLIAERGGGSFRDSISLLDQLSNSGDQITRAVVEEILGLAPETAIAAIIDAVTAHDAPAVVATLSDLFKDGMSPALIVDQLLRELTKLAPEKPKLYDLVEKLLEVAKSSAPDVKLTAILASAAAKTTPTTSAAAIAAPAKSDISEEKLAIIIEKKIEKEAKGKPAKDATRNSTATDNDVIQPPASAAPSTFRAGSALTSAAATTETRNDGLEGVVRESSGASGQSQQDKSIGTVPMDTSETTAKFPTKIVWDDILTEVKNLDEPAVLATLKFADHEYTDGQITLYFAKPFHRKKADTGKFRDTLDQAFQKLYDASPKITISTAAVRENSDAAKILGIMGGGEMVKHGKA